MYNCCDDDWYRRVSLMTPGMMMPGMAGQQMPLYPMQPVMQQPGYGVQPGMQGAPGNGGTLPGTAPGTTPPPGYEVVPKTMVEESYIENILRANKGKIGTFYMTIEGSEEWNSRIFVGRVETAGRDHIIISDPLTGKRYLLLMINLSWVEFDTPITYPDIPIPGDITGGGAPMRD